MNEMTWTKKKPKKSGFYWFRGEIMGYHGSWEKMKSMPVRIDADFEDEPRMYFTGSDASIPLSEARGEFYGPIEKP